VKLVWSKNARERLFETVHLIANDKPQAAKQWADKVIRVTSRLQSFPQSGRIVPELKRSEIREVIVGSYRIIYKLSSRLTILTLFHGTKTGATHALF